TDEQPSTAGRAQDLALERYLPGPATRGRGGPDRRGYLPPREWHGDGQPDPDSRIPVRGTWRIGGRAPSYRIGAAIRGAGAWGLHHLRRGADDDVAGRLADAAQLD